jgi:hypothetical protein
MGYASIYFREFCVLIFNLYKKLSAMQIGFEQSEIIEREGES